MGQSIHIPEGALRPMLQRGENAKASFVECAMRDGLTERDALDAMSYLLKQKLARVDYGVGRINVKHGALLASDVLQRAAKAWRGESI